MARIRTIKPELLRHGGLFDLEQETGLPIRIAFAGLFTVADRQGRFKWQPRTLKLDCLPYDEVDFSRVLDALASGDFICKYSVGGKTYGVIPKFTEHQFINNKERDSALPEPPKPTEPVEIVDSVNAQATRPPREANARPAVLDPCQAEQGTGKGTRNKEGNRERPRKASGAEGIKDGGPAPPRPSTAKITNPSELRAEDFCWTEVLPDGSAAPDSSIAAELSGFIDWSKAKGRRHRDAAAAFRNWLRKASRFSGGSGGSSGPDASNVDFNNFMEA